MKPDTVHNAIEDGHTTASEIADYVDLDYTHVSRELKKMANSDELVREKDGQGYKYYIPNDDADGGPAVKGKMDDSSRVTLRRDYDWDDMVPSGVPEYVATDGEYDEISAEIDYVKEATNPARIRLTGPTGAGKTHLPRYLAQQHDAPLFDISVKWAIDTMDLLGRFQVVNDETQWVNGPLTKAVMASQDRKVILLLDEVNRARAEAKAALFEALDDRCQVTLDALGGKTVEGNAENLILFSTMNVGQGHVVEELDLAEQRRLGGAWNVDYLGLNHPEREAQILTERTPVHDGLAMAMVESANEVRNLAQNPSEKVDRGIPTGLLIEWAASSYKYALGDLANPVMRAANSKVIRAFYADGARDAPGRDAVVTAIQSAFDDCPGDAVIDPDEWDAWAGEDLADAMDMDGSADDAL